MNTVEYSLPSSPAMKRARNQTLSEGEKEKVWLKNTEKEEYERLKNGNSKGKREVRMRLSSMSEWPLFHANVWALEKLDRGQTASERVQTHAGAVRSLKRTNAKQ